MRRCVVVHAGAFSVEARDAEGFEAVCVRAASAGYAALEAGASAVEAAVEAVVVLEDDPHANAGLGSVLNRDGVPETDALVMEGSQLRLGAIAAVTGIKNPIRLAHMLLSERRLNLLAGPGARLYAAEHGVELGDDELLVTERQREDWRLGHERGSDTVGAVVVDAVGRSGAAVSTGGIMGKHPGRVGDTPLPGSGGYADDRIGAAVVTGIGEQIMRVLLSRVSLDRLQEGLSPEAAAESAITLLEERVNGRAGLILVDREGRPGAAFNTQHMPHAWMHDGLSEPVYST